MRVKLTPMFRAFTIFTLLISTNLSALADDFCSRKNDYFSPGIAMDSCFEPTQGRLLKSAALRLRQLQFNPSSKQTLFGARTAQAIQNYLDKNIALLVPNKVVPSRRTHSTLVGRPSPLLAAINLGLVAWLRALVRHQPFARFDTANGYFPIYSPSAGIIQLGKSFDRAPVISQLTTLVHEARHSDCANPNIQSDIKELTRLGYDPLQFLYLRSTCGHTHSMCPQGHPLAKLPACDSQAGQSYGYAAEFASLVANACTNCSEQEKQIATVQAAEARTRIIINR
jgi:hypothetical protein